MPAYILFMVSFEFVLLNWFYKGANYSEYRINILSGIVVVITQSLLQIMLLNKLNPWVFQFRIFEWDNVAISFIVCFVLYTFLQYFTHMLSHKIRLFWCLHEVHHSSIDLNISSGLRNSIFDIISTDIFYLLIPLCGIHPVVYIITYSLAKVWGTFIHINENIVSEIPILNKIIVDPKTHHLHHARNPVYLDKNYCETILIYDKLFKTYVQETEKPIYGSSNNPSPTGFWNVQLNEFRLLGKDIKNSRSISEALKFTFYPPGWLPKYEKEAFSKKSEANSVLV